MMKKMKKRSKGQATIETAVCAIACIPMIMGIWDFSMAIRAKGAVSDSTDAAARAASEQPSKTYANTVGIAAEMMELESHKLPNSPEIVHTTVTFDSGSNDDFLVPGEAIHVHVIYRYHPLFWPQDINFDEHSDYRAQLHASR